MCSKLTRFSRISLSYMNMTMSLSSAWMQAMPPCRATTFNASQMWPCGTMQADVARTDVGGEDLYAGMAVLHGIGELVEVLGTGTSPISMRWKP